jgi:tRNA(Ile)-lysidine synthase
MSDKDLIILKVHSTIKKYNMIRSNSRILVGVSGGPDSICLLKVLNQLSDDYRIKLYAFHLNHKLRGKESDGDEKFVKEFCRNLKVPCRTMKLAIKDYAKQKKLSLEQAAREIRYQLLEGVRKRWQCDKIALGHNANDNAETVISNLVRGTGMRGLAGIPPVRNRIIRPLIKIERDAIVQYLKNNRIDYRIDSTNIDSKIRRNFIRAKIIPKLSKLNPNLIETITRLVDIVREEDKYFNQRTEQMTKMVVIKRTKQGMLLDNKAFLSYNLTLRRRALKLLLPELGFDKIEQILEVSQKKSVGKTEIGSNLIAQREYDRLFIGMPTRRLPVRAIMVPLAKTFDEMGVRLVTKIVSDYDLADKDSNAEVFDYEKISIPLILRYRMPGDKFIPFGGKEKKLKEVLIDDKIPERIRNQLPLLCDSKGILWILGSRRAERARITKKTKKILSVRIKEWKKNPLLKLKIQ